MVKRKRTTRSFIDSYVDMTVLKVAQDYFMIQVPAGGESNEEYY